MKKILTDDQILRSCQSLLSSGNKLTGSSLREKLYFDYGISCDNTRLYRILNQFKKNIFLNSSSSRAINIINKGVNICIQNVTINMNILSLD